MLGITTGWDGSPLEPPLCFSIACDADSLWFVAARSVPAKCRPGAQPGAFTEGLWEWDVAELFLSDPESGRYLELNLAPNGAWWAATFTAPRVRAAVQPGFEGLIRAHAEETPGDGWCAALRIPLALLEREIGYGQMTKANVTAILGSPDQTFHSAAKLPGAVPDFHQPSRFPSIAPSPL